MKYLIALSSLLAIIFSFPVWSQDGGKPKDNHAHATKESEHEHEESEHGEEEGASNVGPGKGIIEASAENGIRLSPEALKNFEIRTLKLTGHGPWPIPTSARLLAGEEVNIYRVRDGAFKRIDFTVTKKTPDNMTINSTDLKSGDEIVISGIGFLRIAELAAFGGAPEGHSH